MGKWSLRGLMKAAGLSLSKRDEARLGEAEVLAEKEIIKAALSTFHKPDTAEMRAEMLAKLLLKQSKPAYVSFTETNRIQSTEPNQANTKETK